MKSKFDVIIATYNRDESLAILIDDILECTLLPEKIIVVDSSNTENVDIQKKDRVVYIKSSHGNQPYQRYLGYSASESEILVYFDDDMRVKDIECFHKIIAEYNDQNVVGVQPNFSSVHNFFDKQMPKSILTKQKPKKKSLKAILKWLTGYPLLPKGKFWLAGIKGGKPGNKEPLEWFYGPVFSARRSKLYDNFNFSLFDMFEEKLGTGEDAILGFTLSNNGMNIYLTEELFHHQDQQDSTYSSDFYTYGKRVAYSRLYLSYEFARQTGLSPFIAKLHFNWYMLFRVLGLLFNQIVNVNSDRRALLRGYITGWVLAIKQNKKLLAFKVDGFWVKEANKDHNSNLKDKS